MSSGVPVTGQKCVTKYIYIYLYPRVALLAKLLAKLENSEKQSNFFKLAQNESLWATVAKILFQVR